LALFDDLARGVMLDVVGDDGSGDRGRGEFPDDDGKEQKRNGRNEEDTSHNQTTFHKVSMVPTVIALNLNDCRPLLDRSAQNFDTDCSRQILLSSYRPR